MGQFGTHLQTGGGPVDAGDITSGVLGVIYGGTGLSSISNGFVLYASGANTLAAGSADTAGLVAKTGTQTIAGAKTFSAAASFPANATFGQSGNIIFCNNGRGIAFSSDGVTNSATQVFRGTTGGGYEFVLVGSESLLVTQNGSNPAIDLRLFDGGSGGTSVLPSIRHKATVNGTAGAGFGGKELFQGSSTTAMRDMVAMKWVWGTATDASRKARGLLTAFDTVEREAIRWEADGSAPMVGFLGASAVAQQSIGAAATDLATVITLANNIRTALIANGLCKI